MLLVFCQKEAHVSQIMPPIYLIVLAEIESVDVPKKIIKEDRKRWGGATWNLVSPSEKSVVVQARPLKIVKDEMGPSADDPQTYKRTLFVQVPQSVAQKGAKIQVRVSERSETKLDKMATVLRIRQTGTVIRTEYVGSSEK